MSLAFAGMDLAAQGSQLRARLAQDAEDANAWMDLSAILQLIGQRDLGLAAQAQALELCPLYQLPAQAGKASIRLLALMAPGDFMTNAPLDFLLEDGDVSLAMLYVSLDSPLPASLPQHDVLFVAMGESESTRPLLEVLVPVVASWPRPVVNRPEKISGSARDQACHLLDAIAGLSMPVTDRLARAALTGHRAHRFPLIIRPLDSHAGQGLAKLDAEEEMDAYLLATPGEEFFVSSFVDYRSADGAHRKYRVALIAGRPYAVHMAISDHWMVHYLNADMNDSAAKRSEEARFMADFDADFGRRHAQALGGIAERLGLDYLVVDCAETADGRLLLFEVDTGAVVHLMDPVEIYPYKRPQMRRVFAAFRQMLEDRSDEHQTKGRPESGEA